MMRKTPLLFIGAVITVTCLFAKALADYDHSVDFGKFHSYSWIGVNVQEPLWQDRVRNAVDSQLSSKGWQKVDTVVT